MANQEDGNGKSGRRPWWTLKRAAITLAVTGSLVIAMSACLYFSMTLVFAPIGAISQDAAFGARGVGMLAYVLIMLLSLATWVLVPGLALLILFSLPVAMRCRRGMALLLFLATIALVFCEITAIASAERHLFDWRFRQTFTALASRSQPLIGAIERYNEANGEYPPSLDSLVPEFIDEVPNTGLAGYPDYEYKLTSDEDKRHGPYELLVKTPSGGLNWDVFVYWPSGAYPDYFYGGVPEFFEPWAYVHE